MHLWTFETNAIQDSGARSATQKFYCGDGGQDHGYANALEHRNTLTEEQHRKNDGKQRLNAGDHCRAGRTKNWHCSNECQVCC